MPLPCRDTDALQTATARHEACEAAAVWGDLQAAFFVGLAYDSAPASRGRHVDQRQHHTGDAGEDEDQTDRRARDARDMKGHRVAEYRAHGNEKY